MTPRHARSWRAVGLALLLLQGPGMIVARTVAIALALAILMTLAGLSSIADEHAAPPIDAPAALSGEKVVVSDPPSAWEHEPTNVGPSVLGDVVTR
jgi:hypothetical protein